MQNYEIRVSGRLDEEWEEWFEGFTITYGEENETVLTGPVTDQAALFGILNKLRNLGLQLLSVVPIE